MKAVSVRTNIEHWLHRQWQRKGAWAWLTAPLALLFGLILKIRAAKYRWLPLRPRDIHVPIVVVGNIYIGGTGKTPVVIAIVKYLLSLGWRPGVISRGYGIDIGNHPLLGQGLLDAHQFGDEPALIANETGVPIAVHPDRLRACRELLAQFPAINVVISDDGLQHLNLARDIELVVADARGNGNGWLLPAGPLREPVNRLKSVHAILTRCDAMPAFETKAVTQFACADDAPIPPRVSSLYLQIVGFRHLLSGQTLSPKAFLSLFQHQRIAALAGIATPERFFSDLRKMGVPLAQTLALPDHCAFSELPFFSLDSNIILMTGKDAVKCKDSTDTRLWVAEVEMTFSDPDFLPWLDLQLQAEASRLRFD